MVRQLAYRYLIPAVYCPFRLASGLTNLVTDFLRKWAFYWILTFVKWPKASFVSLTRLFCRRVCAALRTQLLTCAQYYLDALQASWHLYYSSLAWVIAIDVFFLWINQVQLVLFLSKIYISSSSSFYDPLGFQSSTSKKTVLQLWVVNGF